MKFFFQQSRQLCLYMAQFPARYRYYFTLLIILAIIGSWHIFLYRPIKHSISYYTHTKNILCAQIQEQQKAQDSSLTISKTIKGLEQDLQSYKTSAVNSNELIMFIAKQAAHANLFLANCTAEPFIDHGWFQAQPILIGLQGPPGAICQWLGALSTKTKLLSASSLSITSISPNMIRCSAVISNISITNIG